MREIDDLVSAVQSRLAGLDHTPDEPEIAALVRQQAGVISDLDLLAVLRRLRHDSVGCGVLEQILAVDGVTDVVVTGPDNVFFDRGQGLVRSAVRFADDAAVRRLATRLIVSCGRRLDDAQPFGNGRIRRADGTAVRVHALLSPPSDSGTCLSLRVLRQATTSLAALQRSGTMPPLVATVLAAVVRHRRALLVCGGTGSGKTTVLGALLGQVDPAERIIIIEDTAELKPVHPHTVSLVAQAANAEGSGAITMSALVKQALRMRPDRIVVGEIRGAEIVDLLAALNTGHEGGAGTVHANSLAEIPARMQALGGLGGLDGKALDAQLAAAIDVVVSMRRTRHGRIIDQIGLLSRTTPVTVQPVWDHRRGILDGFTDFAAGLGLDPAGPAATPGFPGAGKGHP
ncbi:TadA family conjugal transfer-associated ATPase [Corynebacterium mendelii]|uniref:TadA family conjugal transfer-associated ATPase n=1 Tax=Corynebacterium mendelii TaxID=2765362 RepID=A0A939DZN8_9CORY|nr:TadA family conjugal transfer-associated ATPase [Corynebacterium mendelii]MBN9643785.1 TadA family conjugal transfer-associated ATPase [Corynebacterium mendelii]